MTVETIKELRAYLDAQRKSGKSIGLVPTMGFLHEGHLSLIRRAKAENDIVVVSDFVNPIQFSPGEDFESYPRDIARDEEKAIGAGADLLFHPSAQEIYPEGCCTFVEVVGDLTKTLCGVSRPSHFKGVTTVVCILFNLVKPDRAYFGQKDAQQAAVLMRMTADLHMGIELVVCPIVREKDGLAMSSRNSYLSQEERAQAVILNRALEKGKAAFETGETRVGELTGIIAAKISEMPLADIDYVSIYEYPSLKAIERVGERALAAVAVRFGKTRLIDNIVLER